MDPTDLSDDLTDITDGGAVTSPDQNPSTNLDANALLSQLIGGATQVATAANTQPSPVFVSPTAPAATPLSSITAATGLSSTMIVAIGVAFVFLIALRK